MRDVITSNLIDLVSRQTYPAQITMEDGKITSVKKINARVETYILPGFIDAHVHIESSMLVPSEFARIAVTHGTVGTISDPHEIANVMGVEGVDYMIANAAPVPFHFYFGAPSCVPATRFETAGAVIDAEEIDALLARKEIVYLAEMMNFPGVIYKDEDVLKKLASAKKHGKPVDGHAPGLMGEDMKTYFKAGITTDHECFMYDEALEKLKQGVYVMIREGSAAKNFDTLIPLLKEFPQQIFFCCDDKHPDSLLEGHINEHVKRALALGHDLYDVLRAASYNVIRHYNLPVGLLQEGDSADFIMIDTLQDFRMLRTYVKGTLVAEGKQSFIKPVEAPVINQFHCSLKKPSDFLVPSNGGIARVIEVIDGQLITNEIHTEILSVNGYACTDTTKDLLKIAVVNRYHEAPVAIAFIKNIGLQSGAIASCVAHDCHNIVVVGVNDEAICRAVNLIIESKGGISLVNGFEELHLALPIAGIMTNQPGEVVAEAYLTLDRRAKELGSKLRAPYMSLSFMALLVIPQLKLSDKGLFNGQTFEFTNVWVS